MKQINQSPTYNSAYRAEIDGLRAFAVLSVIAYHAFPNSLQGGFIGVDVFFVISGFLITTHIFEHLDKGQFSFTDFFRRRIRRIFPALILVMACSLTFGFFVLLADEFSQLGKHVASGAAVITNFILADESGYFNNASETKPMLHLWSLAVEEQFYIFWPLVLWYGWKRKLNLLKITISIAIFSFYLNLRFVKSYPTETFFWPLGRFWEILSGSILAWLLLYKSETMSRFKLLVDKFLVRVIHFKEVKADCSITLNLMSFIGLLLLSWGVIRMNAKLSFPSVWALVPVFGAVLVIASGSKARLNRIFLMNPIAVWFGLISYPLYLWHWPILSFLHIVDGDFPQRDKRIVAVLLSIILAWLTVKFIENPIRFGHLKHKLNTFLIALTLILLGAAGYYVHITDWSETNRMETVYLRKGFEHGFGSSMRWFEGKDGWLFLGNDFDQTVAKQKLAFRPSRQDILNEVSQFKALAKQGMESNTKIALLVGPNKSSVYKEYLPIEITPSDRRYSTFITDQLRSEVSNLITVDPTDTLIDLKSSEGLLYWRTNTHWNQKGSYLAFKALMKNLNLQTPRVEFKQSNEPHSGDLIEINKLIDFPLIAGDDWSFEILDESQIYKDKFEDKQKDPFGWKGRAFNSKALNDTSVWVIGDSFVSALRPYIEASFKEVRYIGHWSDTLISLPSELAKSSEKPDLILVIKVERCF